MTDKTNFAIYLPNYGIPGGVSSLIQMGELAEECGWDGFFVWDHIAPSLTETFVVFDPWVTLAAVATRTEKIRIGTTVTPIARRRPWKLARETVTLDHLSEGRLILAVGLGSSPDAEFARFGEDPDARVRAQKLDEGIEILLGLWSGEPFSFAGKHFKVDDVTFLPKPVQSPRIPLWVGGSWPHKAPFKRAARYDGVFPLFAGYERPLNPKEIEQIVAYVSSQRESEKDFEVVTIGITSGDTAENAYVRELIDAGATWWLECFWPGRAPLDEMFEIIKRGPPDV